MQDIDRRAFMARVGGFTGGSVIARAGSLTTTAASQQGELPPPAGGAAASAVNADPEFRLQARLWNGRVRLAVGDRVQLVVIRNGTIAEWRDERAGEPHDIAISGSANAWRDGFAFRGLTVEGDNVAQVWPYYGALARLVTVVREAMGAPASTFTPRETARAFDAAVGRYVYVRVQGVQYRIYYEETGRGIPLMLQHTAGADGREWRFMLEDPELQSRFRMIAYDLPFHGRSMPPPTVKWWAAEYRLTRSLLLDTVTELARAVGATGGAYMGCALGGDLALDLAVYRPEAFRAVVGINASAGTPNRTGAQTTIESYSHPHVFNSRRTAISVYGNTAPGAPEQQRREIQWIYGQSAPGVIGGDFYYYLIDHHLTDAQLAAIDGTRVAVRLLSGELGPSAGPSGGVRLATQIRGATHHLIPGANYLPMTDDYDNFRRAALPILRAIAEA